MTTRLRTILLVLFCGLGIASFAQPPACSFTKTNNDDCILRLPRGSFVFPPTIQMYPGKRVFVEISGGHSFERYTLDRAAGQATAPPDVGASAFQSLSTVLGAASALGAITTTPAPTSMVIVPTPPSNGAGGAAAPFDRTMSQNLCEDEEDSTECQAYKKDPCKTAPGSDDCRNKKLADAIVQSQADAAKTAAQKQQAQTASDLQLLTRSETCTITLVSAYSTPDCMLKLLRRVGNGMLTMALASKQVYTDLQQDITPDSQPASAAVDLPRILETLCGPAVPDTPVPCALRSGSGLIQRQADASAAAAALLARIPKPLGPTYVDDGGTPRLVNLPATTPVPPLTREVLDAMQLVTEEQAALDAIRKDLEGYASRIQDLTTTMHEGGAGAIVSVGTIADDSGYKYFARTVNYSLNRLNLITNSQQAADDGSKKALIVTISVVYGEAHFEASTGIAVAMRPIRTFAIAPIIASGVQTSADISESKSGPELVPFVMAHYRLGHDFERFHWRSAFYLSGGAGYNVSQESADFLAGPSFALRGVMFSVLCDFGKASRLTQNLTVGEPLGTPATSTTAYVPSTLTTLPTTNYWVPALTFAVSVRVPGITGR